MKIFRSKILSLLFILVIIFSITGTGIHLHYCNIQDKLFTDLIFTGEDNALTVCCSESNLCETSCSIERMNDFQTPSGHSECCVDIIAGVETDDVYQSQNITLELFPAELQLQFAQNLSSSQKNLSFQTVRVDIKPPGFLSTVVLLL